MVARDRIDWEELLRTWVAAGQDPASFGNFTLREIEVVLEGAALAIEREQRRDAWLAWHIAALSRMQRLPKLEIVMPKKRPAPRSGARTWQDQLKMIDLINAMHGGEPRKRRIEAPAKGTR